MQSKLKTELKSKYQELFKKLGIDKKTGRFKNKPNIKFPTYPYIGSKYGLSKKILFIGLDIGSDETPNKIQSFEERRKAIEDKPVSEHNPQIAGTYFTALFFLKDELNLQSYWSKLKNTFSCQRALQNKKELPDINPLSYVALTNYYKFVSKNRENRAGGENRVYQDREIEVDFFFEEVKKFNPDIIVFQSSFFKNKKRLLKKLTDMGKPVYVGPHPAYRGKRGPNHFVKQIVKIVSF